MYKRLSALAAYINIDKAFAEANAGVVDREMPWSRSSRWVDAGTLVLAGVVRLILAALTLHLGFMEYNADGFTRVIHGYEWLQHPRWEVGVWLPLHFWLIGGTLALWGNLYDAPKLLSTIAGLSTIASIYVITRAISSRRAAVIAAFLAAIFPFEVWFSVSGMSDPIFSAFLAASVAGFVHWWRSNRLAPLTFASIMMMAATAIRYEAWFYAAVMVAIVTVTAWHRRARWLPATVVAGSSLSFAAIWVEQSAMVLGGPFAFANQTSTIKSQLAPQNATSGLAERILAYGSAAFQVERSLIVLGVLACLWLLWHQPRHWIGYLVLVGGQALLLSLVSADFSNLGPGSERYLLTNVLLLIPPLAAVVADITLLPGITRFLSAALVAVALLSFSRQLSAPPRSYPDANTRSFGRFLAQQLAAKSSAGSQVAVLLPPPPSDAFNAGYALRILSGHAGDVTITYQPAQLQQDVDTGAAQIWVLDTGTHAPWPQAARTERIGRFVVGWPPRLPHIVVVPSSSPSLYRAQVTGLEPDEGIASWLTSPEGRVAAMPNGRADSNGRVSFAFRPPTEASGQWALSVKIESSGATGVCDFQMPHR